MGFRDTSLLCKIVLILLGLCLIIELIGFAIPFWYAISGPDVIVYTGLWMGCVKRGITVECGHIEDKELPDWFRAVRAFSTLSWLFFLAALVLVLVFMFLMYSKKIVYLIVVCLSFAGAFCALISFAVFVGRSADEAKEHLSASFGLTIVAFILGLITGVLGILDFSWFSSQK
ncbi:hypothetical protein CHS0354_039772 [Potamilus streckersoni]|uniref:Uncharacterized protein n=1 Tax=Potamilus streckersoni TaxID=2493646 RepID=A0AAE0S0J7_9BIVA|nr:hypothetical protein CHS0354_039772 [Potamilus streckersoni]